MRRIALMLALFLLFGIGGDAWAQADAEIAKLDQAYVKAFNEGNLDAMVSLFADNAIGYSPFSPVRYEGREGVRANFKGTFERTPKRELVAREVSIRVYGNTAVVDKYQDVTAMDREGKVIRKATDRATTVWVKLGEKWQIVTHHASREVPPPR